MREVVFDLTEVFSASTGRLRYYGIVRVVAEIASELVRRKAAVRFGYFSYAHRAMLEVTPRLLDDGTVDLDVPSGLKELRIRPPYQRKSVATRLAMRVINPLLNRRNQKAWAQSGLTATPMDVTGSVIVSASRPKLIVDVMTALDAAKASYDLLPILHDMIPLHPQFGHKSAFFPGKFLDDNRLVIARAQQIVTVSQFTRGDILDFAQAGMLPAPPEITPVPLVHQCVPGEEPLSDDLPQGPYLLTVGATLGRKNLEVSFDALRILTEQGGPVPSLVIAGAVRKSTRRKISQPEFDGIRNNIIFYPDPDQSNLVALYENALAVVMASRMEGWGLPAGEALWCGTPVLCSSAPVLHEVCGDLALYFDPDAPNVLAEHVNRLMTDTDFRAAWRDRIAAARGDLRTWAHVTDDLVRVMEDLPA